MSENKNLLLQFVKRYGPQAGEHGPVRFVQEVFGVKLDKWQKDALRAYGRGERGISIRSCHGPGKTAVAAWCIWHQLLVRFPQKTVATAPSKGQLEDGLFVEVLKWKNRLPVELQEQFTYKGTRIELSARPEESFFSIRTSRAESPEALQGIHMDPGYVLLIADEASGVPEQVYEAAEGSMSGHNCQTLLISNPVRGSGFFYDTHHKLKDLWYTIHVSYKDSSRVSEAYVEGVRRRRGENSNYFRVRCLGAFPLSDDDTMIPLGLVVSAQQRDITPKKDLPRVWGLDVARFGSDRCALVERTSREARVLDTWGRQDTMQTAGRVKALWDKTPVPERPETILVDVIGIGSGVADRLRELGLPVRDINVSETANMDDRYFNLRSELWGLAREWLEKKNARLPSPDREQDPREDYAVLLADELVTPKYTFTSTGKMKLESKADMKKRGHDSPNIADAFVLTFAEDISTLMWGSSDRKSWGDELRRNLVTV